MHCAAKKDRSYLREKLQLRSKFVLVIAMFHIFGGMRTSLTLVQTNRRSLFTDLVYCTIASIFYASWSVCFRPNLNQGLRWFASSVTAFNHDLISEKIVIYTEYLHLLLLIWIPLSKPNDLISFAFFFSLYRLLFSYKLAFPF